MLSGYQAYAAEHGLADPAKIGDYFMEYLQTEEARRTLSAALAGMVDTGGMAQVMQQAMADALNQLMPQIAEKLATAVSSALQTQLSQNMNQSGEKLQQAFQDAFHVDADAFSGAIQVNMTEEELSEVLMSLMTASSSSYDGNLQALGYADPAEPSAISIYPLDFEAKEQVLAILDGYNARMQQSGQEEKVITYTDMVGTLMSSVTDIINVISYVLVAFVAISLIVSSIMIGVITYISVLERKKEIGILRAIGASKGNISHWHHTSFAGAGQPHHPPNCKQHRCQRCAARRCGGYSGGAQCAAYAAWWAYSLEKGRQARPCYGFAHRVTHSAHEAGTFLAPIFLTCRWMQI